MAAPTNTTTSNSQRLMRDRDTHSNSTQQHSHNPDTTPHRRDHRGSGGGTTTKHQHHHDFSYERSDLHGGKPSPGGDNDASHEVQRSVVSGGRAATRSDDDDKPPRPQRRDADGGSIYVHVASRPKCVFVVKLSRVSHLPAATTPTTGRGRAPHDHLRDTDSLSLQQRQHFELCAYYDQNGKGSDAAQIRAAAPASSAKKSSGGPPHTPPSPRGSPGHPRPAPICPDGDACPYVHADLRGATHHTPHTLEAALAGRYECLPAGTSVAMRLPREWYDGSQSLTPDALAAAMAHTLSTSGDNNATAAGSPPSFPHPPPLQGTLPEATDGLDEPVATLPPRATSDGDDRHSPHITSPAESGGVRRIADGANVTAVTTPSTSGGGGGGIWRQEATIYHPSELVVVTRAVVRATATPKMAAGNQQQQKQQQQQTCDDDARHASSLPNPHQRAGINDTAAPLSHLPTPPLPLACPHFLTRGRCDRGERCRFVHPLFSSSVSSPEAAGAVPGGDAASDVAAQTAPHLPQASPSDVQPPRQHPNVPKSRPRCEVRHIGLRTHRRVHDPYAARPLSSLPSSRRPSDTTTAAGESHPAMRQPAATAESEQLRGDKRM